MAEDPICVDIVCTATDWTDIGHGVSIQQRFMNGELAVVAWKHPCKPYGVREDSIPVRYNGWPDEGWSLIQPEPITLSPSVLCLVETCRFHGFVREGKWVPA